MRSANEKHDVWNRSYQWKSYSASRYDTKGIKEYKSVPVLMPMEVTWDILYLSIFYRNIRSRPSIKQGKKSLPTPGNTVSSVAGQTSKITNNEKVNSSGVMGKLLAGSTMERETAKKGGSTKIVGQVSSSHSWVCTSCDPYYIM